MRTAGEKKEIGAYRFLRTEQNLGDQTLTRGTMNICRTFVWSGYHLKQLHRIQPTPGDATTNIRLTLSVVRGGQKTSV
jgi:hypothetical protein